MSEFLGSPVDPLDGPAFALGGRVVTMDAHGNSLHKDIEQESGVRLQMAGG